MVENNKNNLEQSDSQAENAENQMQQEPVNVEMTETENANTSSQPFIFLNIFSFLSRKMIVLQLVFNNIMSNLLNFNL